MSDDPPTRCPWGQSPPENQLYHDEEWGRPVSEENRIFEKLCLESFQSGLSWLTILRKREGFRRAFAFFDPEVVAGFGETDVERLLSNAAIVRHRGKIEATVANARAVVALHEQSRSVAALLWEHEPPVTTPPDRHAGLPASTSESLALARRLKGLGFRFLGPTTIYSAMQSLGLVNDHLVDCYVREPVEILRSNFERPT